ncbi:hypothetical protein [Streptomyces albidoflavus]|uniref:hypothetical protein n=1 Tax=Streptomyces albidoflavus TaxID=1886 RepID=UPI0033E4948A
MTGLPHYTDDPVMDRVRPQHRLSLTIDHAASALRGYAVYASSCSCRRWENAAPWDVHAQSEAFDGHMSAVQADAHRALAATQAARAIPNSTTRPGEQQEPSDAEMRAHYEESVPTAEVTVLAAFAAALPMHLLDDVSGDLRSFLREAHWRVRHGKEGTLRTRVPLSLLPEIADGARHCRTALFHTDVSRSAASTLETHVRHLIAANAHRKPKTACPEGDGSACIPWCQHPPF